MRSIDTSSVGKNMRQRAFSAKFAVSLCELLACLLEPELFPTWLFIPWRSICTVYRLVICRWNARMDRPFLPGIALFGRICKGRGKYLITIESAFSLPSALLDVGAHFWYWKGFWGLQKPPCSLCPGVVKYHWEWDVAARLARVRAHFHWCNLLYHSL